MPGPIKPKFHRPSQSGEFVLQLAASVLKVRGKTVGGIAYPGFNDFYAPGGAGNTLFYIPEVNPQTQTTTLSDLLNLYTTYQSRLDFLQLAMFNDYGEGTMFEPTVETGFKYLKQIQEFTGVSYDEDELQLDLSALPGAKEVLRRRADRRDTGSGVDAVDRVGGRRSGRPLGFGGSGGRL